MLLLLYCRQGRGIGIQLRCLLVIVYRYNVRTRTTWIRLDSTGIPAGWFHAVLTFQGDQIRVYQNKILQSRPLQTGPVSHPSGPGRVVIGKGFIDRDNYMGSVAVDELAMWNQALSEAEVAQLYNMFSQYHVTMTMMGTL